MAIAPSRRRETHDRLAASPLEALQQLTSSLFERVTVYPVALGTSGQLTTGPLGPGVTVTENAEATEPLVAPGGGVTADWRLPGAAS